MQNPLTHRPGESMDISLPGVDVSAGELTIIAGPCAVESLDQIVAIAHEVRDAGAQCLRGGAFKPRTSPYSFQGLGVPALEMLREAREATGLPIVTELMDAREAEVVASIANVIQIGARNMNNTTLLREAARLQLPILLKRNMGATVADLLDAADYILAEGNEQIILCERGIRTFEDSTRYTLDVAAIPVLKQRTHLPVFVDPSHAAGDSTLVTSLACAAVAAGADGLLVEVHTNPAEAFSDGYQSLNPVEFAAMVEAVRSVHQALPRHNQLAALATL